MFVCGLELPSQLDRVETQREKDGDESVAERGGDDGGLCCIGGGKVNSENQSKGHSF